MKKLSTFIFCLLSLGTLVAQFQLDVEGDAKILGKLEVDSGEENTFVGKLAGSINTTGSENAFFGRSAGINNTEGSYNAFFGKSAGFNNTEGSNNAFFGKAAGYKNIGGSNAFFGHDSGYKNIGGESNAFFGRGAGYSNIDGGNNAFFGRGAGNNYNNSRSTLLGAFTDVATDSLDRAIAIGYEAIVACHNCAVIGGIGDNAVKVGIGTSTPLTDLHIKQSVNAVTNPANTNGLTLEYANGDDKWKIYHSASHLSFAENTSPTNTTSIRRSYISKSNGAYVRADGGSNLRSQNSSRVKENILDKLVALSVKHYPSLNSRNKTQKSLGFNTLEVQKLFPEVVREAEDGSLGMAYADFGILAIKAIQELVVTVEEQGQENILQKEQIVTLAERLDDTDALRETVNTQQNQINELKSLVEKLLTQNAETPKSTSYVLPLEQQALLAQNQPNPFRENTLVDYFVPAEVQNAHIQVTGLDGQVLGQVSITQKGKGQVTIQSKSYPAGTYFYSLVLDGEVMETKRMVLAR